jgi:hypothetical protein
MLVASWRKDLPFTFGSNFGPWNFHDVRYANPPQLANLPCACILVGEPRRMNQMQARLIASSPSRPPGTTLTFDHQRPSRSRDLVRKRNGRHLCRPSPQQRREPRAMLGAVDFGVPDDGKRPGRQQAAQIEIASFADIAKPVLAFARVLLPSGSGWSLASAATPSSCSTPLRPASATIGTPPEERG